MVSFLGLNKQIFKPTVKRQAKSATQTVGNRRASILDSVSRNDNPPQ